jgi:hypothetical protein
MKFRDHGKEFPSNIKTMQSHLEKICGVRRVLSPEPSKKDTKKKSRSALLLECNDVMYTPSR